MLVTPALSAGTTMRGKVKTRLLLARHGETDWNTQGRWQGQEDVPLNSKGKEQALKLAARLKGESLAAVYSSALRRAIETAQEVALHHRINVCRDARLNEINLGSWEGLPYKEIAARYPDLLAAWNSDPQSVRPPGGESIAELEQRVLDATQEIALAFPGETVCLIGHKMTNGVIRHHYLGLELNEALRGEPEHAVCEVVEIPHPLWG
jgi:broad specificity phosphatase PhoE